MDELHHAAQANLQRIHGPDQHLQGEKPTPNQTGKWIQSDPDEDERMQMFHSMPSQPPNGKPGWGTKDMVADSINWARRKKKQAAYFSFANWAQALYDIKDPVSHRKSMLLMPEYRDVPEDAYTRDAATQLTLKRLVVDGEVHSRQDLEFLYYILHPAYEIPVKPLWDTDERMFNWLIESSGIRRTISEQNSFQRGLVTPFRYNYMSEQDAKQYLRQNGWQWMIKKLIARRVLPGLRDATEAQVEESLKLIHNDANYGDTDVPGGLDASARLAFDGRRYSDAGIVPHAGYNRDM